MDTEKRIAAYLAQTGRKLLTPRQRRRVLHKDASAVLPQDTPGTAGKGKGGRGKKA
jgi:hypothetical protein